MAKEVKILLNGKTYASDCSDITKSAYCFRIESGDTLTIMGEGTVDGMRGCANNMCVWLRENAHLNIYGGDFKVGRDSAGSGNSTIYVHKDGAVVRIYGGTFKGPQTLDHHPGWYYLLNINNSVKTYDIQVMGGTWYGWNPEDGDDEIKGVSFLAEGYKVEVEDGKDDEGLDCKIYKVVPSKEL